MKLKNLLFCSLFLICLSLTGQSQNGNLPTEEILMLQSINQVPPVDQREINSNSIYIEQVGSDNKIFSKIATVSSNVNLFQDGSHNDISLKVSAKGFSANVLQHGNFNNVFDFSHAPSEDISLNLTQNGRDQHFESHGSNSISNKLRFNMNGDFNSIIVRNSK